MGTGTIRSGQGRASSNSFSYLLTPPNWSRGMCATVVKDADLGVFEFIWPFKTQPVSGRPEPGARHDGTHCLRLIERDAGRFLEGEYYTNRLRADNTIGSGGYIIVKWVSSSMKSAIDYRPNDWPIAKPTGDPPASF